MSRSRCFKAIVCALVFGALSPIHGQAPAGSTYVNATTPADRLQLNADMSFSLQESGQTYHGTFSISGKTLELKIGETNSSTLATIQGAELTDSSGQKWVLREQPAHPASTADAFKNQDVISLVKAGLDDDIVIAKIGSSECQFDISPEAVTHLRQSGVSAAVINRMVGSRTAATASGSTPSTLPLTTPGVPPQPAPPAAQTYTKVTLGITNKPLFFGEVALKLRSADPEKQMYSVEVMADDKVTLKQNKNVNEVLQFYTAKGGNTPYNLRIDQVTRDGIAGQLWREGGTTPNPPGAAASPSTGPALMTGRVVWNGQPVPNVEVQLRQASGSEPHPVLAGTVSAADGTFTIENPPAGRLAIYALGPTNDYWPFQIYQQTIIAGQSKNVGDLAIAKKMQLLSPANGATITNTTPALQWTTFPGAVRYDVSVRDSATSQQVFSHSTGGVQITVLPALQEGHRYQWTVQAYNFSGHRIAWSFWTLHTSPNPEPQAGVRSEVQSTVQPASSTPGPIDGEAPGTFHLVEERHSNGAGWAVIYDLRGTYSVGPGEVLVTIESGSARKAHSQTNDPVLGSLRLGVCYQSSADGRFGAYPQVADARQQVSLNDVTLKDGDTFQFSPGSFRIPVPSPTPERNWLCSFLSEPNGHYYPAHSTGRRILISPPAAATQIRVRNDTGRHLKDLW